MGIFSKLDRLFLVPSYNYLPCCLYIRHCNFCNIHKHVKYKLNCLGINFSSKPSEMIEGAKMEKKITRNLRKLGAIKPANIISHRRCSTSPKLETILEEEFESSQIQFIPKNVLFLLLVFFSSISYYLILSTN